MPPATDGSPEVAPQTMYPSPRSHWPDWLSDGYCLIRYDFNTLLKFYKAVFFLKNAKGRILKELFINTGL